MTEKGSLIASSEFLTSTVAFFFLRTPLTDLQVERFEFRRFKLTTKDPGGAAVGVPSKINYVYRRSKVYPCPAR